MAKQYEGRVRAGRFRCRYCRGRPLLLQYLNGSRSDRLMEKNRGELFVFFTT